MFRQPKGRAELKGVTNQTGRFLDLPKNNGPSNADTTAPATLIKLARVHLLKTAGEVANACLLFARERRVRLALAQRPRLRRFACVRLRLFACTNESARPSRLQAATMLQVFSLLHRKPTSRGNGISLLKWAVVPVFQSGQVHGITIIAEAYRDVCICQPDPAGHARNIPLTIAHRSAGKENRMLDADISERRPHTNL